MFGATPFTKAASAGPRVNTAEQWVAGSPNPVESCDDGSFGIVGPLKFEFDLTIKLHAVEAAPQGACALNETDSVVDAVAVTPRPWIWFDEANVTPACGATDRIDQPVGAVRLNELALPPVVLSVNV
jgi:hypothetical protein